MAKENGLKKFFKVLGPGFITGASDDDPSGIGTYAQTGAQFGFSQLWLALFCFPFMSVVQEMCGRIGLVTGKGLAQVLKEHFPKPLLYGSVFIVLVANIVNIGADLGAMAAAAHLILKWPFFVWLLGMTFFSIALQVFVPYNKYANILKYLTLSLFAYIITAFAVHLDWGKVLYSTVVPNFSMSKDYLLNIVAILGTTISPYLFFWQASVEVEHEIDKGKLSAMGAEQPKIKKPHIKAMRLDTLVGMFFSQVVMFFIIVTTAGTLHVHGVKTIETAAQAAQALKPIAGDFASLIFAAGIIGTGLLAVPVLAGSASYALSETFGWKQGLYRKLHDAWGFYIVIALATAIGFCINFAGIQPFKMLYYTAVLNGICAPPLMALIILICNDRKIMGDFTNHWGFNLLGWLITAIMAVAAVALLLTMGKG